MILRDISIIVALKRPCRKHWLEAILDCISTECPSSTPHDCLIQFSFFAFLKREKSFMSKLPSVFFWVTVVFFMLPGVFISNEVKSDLVSLCGEVFWDYITVRPHKYEFLSVWLYLFWCKIEISLKNTHTYIYLSQKTHSHLRIDHRKKLVHQHCSVGIYHLSYFMLIILYTSWLGIEPSHNSSDFARVIFTPAWAPLATFQNVRAASQISKKQTPGKRWQETVPIYH